MVGKSDEFFVTVLVQNAMIVMPSLELQSLALLHDVGPAERIVGVGVDEVVGGGARILIGGGLSHRPGERTRSLRPLRFLWLLCFLCTQAD